MSILISNDCSSYHIGSRLTTQVLKKLFSRHGKVWTSRYGNPEKHDLIVINGEGTFHHDTKASKALYETALKSKRAGKRVCLINSVIDSISSDLSIFDYVSSRESLSGGKEYPFVHDPCFYVDVRSAPISEYVLFVDSVMRNKDKQVIESYNSYNGPKKYIKLTDYHSREIFDIFSRASFVVTGRYHGVVFSMMLKKPFVALKSNSHKIEGILQDYGLSNNLKEDISNIKDFMLDNAPYINVEPIRRGLEVMVSKCII